MLFFVKQKTATDSSSAAIDLMRNSETFNIFDLNVESICRVGSNMGVKVFETPANTSKGSPGS